jgi:hypothetical protein
VKELDMKRHAAVTLTFLAVLVLLSTLIVLAADAPAKTTDTGSPAMLGSKDSAKWTETTTKAAGTPEQKKVLDSGKATTITGELVEVSCYLQLGKKGEAHIPCGRDCIKHGQPAGILDSKGSSRCSSSRSTTRAAWARSTSRTSSPISWRSR